MATYAKYKSLGHKENNEEQVVEIPQIKSIDHKLDLINTHHITVVLISGEWCGPCKMVKPKYSHIVKQYTNPGVCAIFIEDVDKQFSDVNGVPAFQIFFRGKLVKTIVGADIDSVQQHIIELHKHINN